MRRLSLAGITLADTPQADAVRIAADAGFRGICLSMGMNASVGRRRRATIVGDAETRHAVGRALADTGLAFDAAEGMAIDPAVDFERVRDALMIVRDLGARRFSLTAWDADEARARDTLRRYCDIAAELELEVGIEFTPLSTVKTLADTVAMVRSGEYPGLRIVPDSLHLSRAGETAEALAAVPPEWIGIAQICDGPAHSPGREAYMHEALRERMLPGDGELPLVAFVRALPEDHIVAVELPNKTLEDRGVSAIERARLYFAAASAVMREAEG